MTRSPRTLKPETPDPSEETDEDSGSRRDNMWLVAQQLHELTGDFAKISAKTDRLIADVGDIEKDVRGLSHSLTLAKGFGACAIILIPIFAGFVWWLIGGKLNDIRDQIQARPSLSAPSSTERKQ